MILEPQSKFSLKKIEDIVDADASLSLSKKAQERLKKTAKIAQKWANSKKAIYGLNTGFGRLADVRISKKELTKLQVNILRSHASGIGKPLPVRVVKRLLFLRALSLGKGYSGISPELVQRHLLYINKGLSPFVPEQGSVGASGDLAPLAHIGLTFMGEGDFYEKGRRAPASKVLKREKLKAIQIKPKEGLALVNGTQFSLAIALEARRELHELLPWMEWAACLSIEAHRATDVVFSKELHELKDHKHQKQVAARIEKRLLGSKHIKNHENCDLVQDSYSFRCIPQVLGPAYSLLEKTDQLLEAEANSVSDNPIVLLKSKRLVTGGHFHAQSVSMAADLMALSMATIGNLTERRIDQLVSPLTTRGSSFFADKPGVESGLMIVQTGAASIASENKTYAQPASADTIPTNGNQEDHVSMAPWAGRKALIMVSNLRKLVAAEILCSVRGCVHESKRTGLAYSKGVESLLARFSKEIPSLFLAGDREFGKDWEKTEKYISETLAPK